MNKFLDKINITDEIGPHGLVIIRDKDGNILVKRHNMVVKGGKEILFYKLLETKNFSSNENSNYKLSKLYFGDSMNETTFDYEKIDRLEIKSEDNKVVGYHYSYDVSNISSTGMTEDGHPFIEFNISGILCDPSKVAYISTLSVVADIIVSSGDNSTNEKLFSRIKFDPIPMVEGNELTLLYYIYF